MLPLIFTVVEFSAQEGYGNVAFQVSSSDINFHTGDMVRFTVSLEFLENLNVWDTFTGNLEKVVIEE